MNSIDVYNLKEVCDFCDKHNANNKFHEFAFVGEKTMAQIWEKADNRMLIWMATRPFVLDTIGVVEFAKMCCNYASYFATNNPRAITAASDSTKHLCNVFDFTRKAICFSLLTIVSFCVFSFLACVTVYNIMIPETSIIFFFCALTGFLTSMLFIDAKESIEEAFRCIGNVAEDTQRAANAISAEVGIEELNRQANWLRAHYPNPFFLRNHSFLHKMFSFL